MTIPVNYAGVNVIAFPANSLARRDLHGHSICLVIMSVPLILNPAARSMRAGMLESRIRTLTPAPELHMTVAPGDAQRLAFELAGEGHRLIVVAGGDGSVNEAVQGLVQHNLTVSDPANHAALGILPVGTMNVFAHELGLPKSVEKCWERIHERRLRTIDLWKANEQYFIQLAGVGLDAEIVKQTSWKLKKQLGPLSYAVTAARVLGQQQPALTVHIEGRPALHGSIVLVGNGRHYGGPVPVFSNARNDDGLLDIIIFHGQGPLEVFQFLSAIAVTGYEQCGDLDYLQAREFRVECSQESPYELDGEFAGHVPVHFNPAPFKMLVAC